MITVTYENCTIKNIGHVNYAEAGKYIVCAGVSILTHTPVSSLTGFTEDEIKVELDFGYIKCPSIILFNWFREEFYFRRETMKPRTKEERKRGEEARKEFLKFMKERSGQ